MANTKIGFSIGKKYAVSLVEMVRLVAEAGFDAVSPCWRRELDLVPVIETARELGLEIQSLHGPFHWVDELWSEDPAISNHALEEIMDSLEDCHKFRIPLMVMHVWIHFDYTTVPNATGLKNYEKIVNKAREYGIQIAFENTEGVEFLRALMEHFKDEPLVGFCWDSGHELCYGPELDLLGEFGDRLIMTHLNDNMGVSDPGGKITSWDDLHLVPYDGIGNWDDFIARLRRSRKQATLNLELSLESKEGRHENDRYSQMELSEYLALCYRQACRIVQAYEA